jgi:phosphoglycolate phosphatase
MSGRHYRHIIWDWNGTLLDDLDLSIAAMNRILARRGRPAIDRAQYQAAFDFPVRDYYARLGLDVSQFAELGAEFIADYDRERWQCRLHAGAAEILAAIQAAGLTQSILSAYRQETLEEIVAHLGLTSRFVALTGLDNIYAHSKVELGRTWIQQARLSPDSILLVGDTRHDHEVATCLGVDCVLVAHGHHSLERLRTCVTDVLPDLPALGRWLELPAFREAPADLAGRRGTAG